MIKARDPIKPKKRPKDDVVAKSKDAAGNEGRDDSGRSVGRDGARPDAGRLPDGAGDLQVEGRGVGKDRKRVRANAGGARGSRVSGKAGGAKAEKPARTAEDEATVRLIFPCPRSMAEQIEGERFRRKLKSTSATIRELLGEALK